MKFVFLFFLSLSLDSLAQALPDHSIRPADINCVIQAAQRQQVPANLLLAIASIEGGKNGQYVGNENGTQDIGHFQLNTTHWQRNGIFARFDISQEDVAWRGCYNAELAAWLLRQHLQAASDQDYWTKAANYHSKTPKFNRIYRSKLIPLAVRWGDWLRLQYFDSIVQYQN
jgi:hypothetical protein